ncbi:DNA polymerase III subunit alpha [compost metagenome]
MIPFQLGITLDDALKLNPELQKQYVQNPRIGKLMDLARRVEGMPRHASTHAAGVVISRERLTRHVPLQEGTDGTPLTQFAMENLEAVGLLKMDFLGLRTLSIIERTQRWLEDSTGTPIRFGEVPDSDPATYELMSRGDTTGVFQLESAGMRRVLRDLKPSEFEDVISVLALYRPGPMEFIPKYIAGKHGQIQVEYPHPNLEPILKDTYGIIVYQEQIMQIASRMAGFSLGEADLLRRAVSKKKREVLDQERKHFVAGSGKLGYTEEEANRVYDMIVRFADYGFPRAHATAYGVLAFRTAYLKAHYPVFFMASMLTAVIGSHRKVAEYVDDCRRLSIAVLPPDVNESGIAFTPIPWAEDAAPAGDADKRGRIRFGLAAIKNVGTQAIESIRKERADGGPFENLLDFCRRVDLRVCNKRVIESLIQSGAMDSFPGHRAQHLAMLEETVEAALKWKKEREDLQLHLFGFTEEPNWHIEYPEIRPYSTQQILELERELLGLYLSGHPLDDYEEPLAVLGAVPLYQLDELPDESLAVTAGRVVSLKTITTKKGQMMAFAEVEDRIERLELVLFPETWKRFGSVVEKGSLLLIGAKLQHQDEEEGVKLLAERIEPLNADFRPERYKNWLAKSGERRQERPAGETQPRPASRPAAAPGGAAHERRPAYNREAGRNSQPNQARVTAGSNPVSQIRVPAGETLAAAAGEGGAVQAVPPVSRSREAVPGRSQRLFIKISGEKEQAGILPRLEALLKSAKGPLETVLFYEREQRLLALSDQYRIKPSPELIDSIDQLLGAGSAKVK